MNVLTKGRFKAYQSKIFNIFNEEAMRKFIFTFFLLCSVVACAPTTSHHKPTVIEEYTPNGRREIIFVHDKYMASNFYDGIDSYGVIGPSQYSMMRGYLLNEKQEVGGRFHYYAFKMENGNILYYRTYSYEKINEKFNEKLKTSDSVFWYEDYQKYNSRIGKPFVPGSSITCVAYKRRFYEAYELSNGKTIGLSKLNALEILLSQLKKNKAKIAETLLDRKVRYEEFDDFFRFDSDATSAGSSVKMSVTKEKNNTNARLSFAYVGRNWVFVDTIVPLVDGKKYAPIHGKAARGNTDVVIEILGFPYEGRISKLANEIAASKKTIIRFYGKRGYEDLLVPEEQKVNLQNAIKLYNLLKSSV